MDDADIWNVTLSQTQVQAMYNTEMVPGLQATDLYGQGTMAKLFGLYSAETGSVKVGNLTWKYATGLSGGAGSAWQSKRRLLHPTRQRRHGLEYGGAHSRRRQRGWSG